MALFAAFQVVLFSRTGRTDILVGTDMAGRDRPETEGLIGFFVNLLVLRTDLGGAPTFRALLERVRQGALEAYAHQDLPFEQVVDAVRPGREPGRHPLVQVLFVLQNVPARTIELPGLQLRAIELDREVSRFDVGVFAEELDAQAAKLNRRVPVMVQVNASEEPQKFGVAVGASVHLAEQVDSMPNLQVVGLMTMAPFDADEKVVRHCFTRTREIVEEMKWHKIGGSALRHLSMGMSNDFEWAIQEGATMVRVGSLLFGGKPADEEQVEE